MTMRSLVAMMVVVLIATTATALTIIDDTMMQDDGIGSGMMLGAKPSDWSGCWTMGYQSDPSTMFSIYKLNIPQKVFPPAPANNITFTGDTFIIYAGPKSPGISQRGIINNGSLVSNGRLIFQTRTTWPSDRSVMRIEFAAQPLAKMIRGRRCGRWSPTNATCTTDWMPFYAIHQCNRTTTTTTAIEEAMTTSPVVEPAAAAPVAPSVLANPIPSDWSGCWLMTSEFGYSNQFTFFINATSWSSSPIHFTGNWTVMATGQVGYLDSGVLTQDGHIEFATRGLQVDSHLVVDAPSPAIGAPVKGTFCNVARGTEDCYTSWYRIDGVHKCSKQLPMSSSLAPMVELSSIAAKRADSMVA